VTYADRAGRWATRLAARVDAAELERLTAGVLGTIDEVSNNRWDAAVKRAAAQPGRIRPEKIKALTDAFARELGAAGAAAGVVAASPAFGTTATLLSATAELGWFTARAGDLILTIAALHGRPDPTVDERRAWLLAVLIYGGSARDEFARAVNEASTGMVTVGPEKRLPVGAIQLANRVMSKALFRKYGARRGLAAVGRMIPLGIGAVIGATANYAAIHSLARNADEFFARLPYSAIDVDSTDVTGRAVTL
jgi:EcsC protein family